MDKKKIIAAIIIILLAGNVFFIWKYSAAKKELNEQKILLKTQTKNEKVHEFSKMFVVSVLKADKEVDFDTRLKLENMVRNLNDKEILDQWNKFTKSASEQEAQKEVKNLLELLVNKI